MPGKMPKKNETAVIGERIARLVKSLGMNQSSFAAAINTRPSTVSKWTAGHNRPSPDVLVKIAGLANDADKVFFLAHAGIPEGYFKGDQMVTELFDASAEVVAKTFSAAGEGVFTKLSPFRIIPLLKDSRKLGAEVHTHDSELTLGLPAVWFGKDSNLQAVRFTNLHSPLFDGPLIAVVDTSRKDPDRLKNCIVAVGTPAGIEVMKLEEDAGTYLLVPMRDEVTRSVRILRNCSECKIIGKVVKWVGDPPTGKK